MDTEETSKTLNITDDLDLTNKDFPEIPSDVIFPDELNRFLRQQIQYLILENGMLKKNLANKESVCDESKTQINELETKLKKFESSSNKNEYVSSSQVASHKIVELSKKLREKNSEVETLKTKCSKLEQHIFDIKKELILEPVPVPTNIKDNTETDENELKKLQDKVAILKSKLFDTKNNNMQLKNDIKLANKWLQQEIGESFENLLSLNNSNTNWRGRAQVICDLQQKNGELKEKVKLLQQKDKNSNSISVSDVNIIQPKIETRLNNLAKENKELKINYEDVKKKFETIKARYKVLDTETILLSSKYEMMKEQSERDQEIINTLSTQISNYREIKNDVAKQKESIISKLRKENEMLNTQIIKLQCKIDNILKENAKKDVKLSSANIQEKIFDEKTKIRLEAEIQKLLELLEVNNNRIKTERNFVAKIQNQLRYEKQRSAKLEANLARLELDQKQNATSRSSSYCSSIFKPTDNSVADKLELAEENIKALKTRLEIEHQERITDLQEFKNILQSYEKLK